MEPRGSDALARFARDHHVHYEVEPEVVDGAQRELVGVQVRLFATPDKAKLVAPAGPRWAELLRDLRSFAEQLVASGDAASRIEIVPAAPKLYQSPEEPDADEVALTLRVHCDSPDHRKPDAGEDPCLTPLRQRLEAIGVSQR